MDTGSPAEKVVTGRAAEEKAKGLTGGSWRGPCRTLLGEVPMGCSWKGAEGGSSGTEEALPNVLSEEDWPLDTVVAHEPGGRTAGSLARDPEAVEELQSSFIRSSVADPRPEDLQKESRLVELTGELLPDSVGNEFDVETCGTASENLGKVPILRYVRCNLVSPPRYYK